MRMCLNVVMIASTLVCTPATWADSFGDGANRFTIDFVPIGNPGNPADVTDVLRPTGQVAYAYRMGQFEISNDMIDKANAAGDLGITRFRKISRDEGPYANKPATEISWYEAAIFVNWLNTNRGHAPAYRFDSGAFGTWQPGDAGFNPANPYRNSNAAYFLPSTDEWYKAAYYDPAAGVYHDYPTGSSTPPDLIDFDGDANFDVVVAPKESSLNIFNYDFFPREVTSAGVLSPYGTAGQGGNVEEWMESESDQSNDLSWNARETRGGAWFGGNLRASMSELFNPPDGEGLAVGFRVASVIPEPSTLLLASVATAGLLARRRRKPREPTARSAQRPKAQHGAAAPAVAFG